MHNVKSSVFCLLPLLLCHGIHGAWMSKEEIRSYRERAQRMFYHGYENYLKHAFPLDELQPIRCGGQDTWGSYSLTLIDALDTLLIMGNVTEFRRVVELLQNSLTFDDDVNASVFETNIRVVGGLLAAHLLQQRSGMQLDEGYPCEGPLLRLAVAAAEKLLPAFDTATGMPYGTVNFLNGVPEGETPVTCTASCGTFILEFQTISQLTGDDRFEKAAKRALDAIWDHRSEIGLVGNHIDVQSGLWTAVDSGIGAGIDSYFEYLVKGAVLFGEPRLYDMFKELNEAVQKHMKFDDWYIWVNMEKGQITMPFFQSLDAYWPGLQVLTGHIGDASRTLYKYHRVWKQFGFTPEFFHIGEGKPFKGREGYPLRPELIESTMYLYQATKDPYFLNIGRDIIESIEKEAWTPCGYTTVKNVLTRERDDRMESFFLAETTKYLYLLFDEENFIHTSDGAAFSTASSSVMSEGKSAATEACPIGAAGYVFTTEAHPLDIAAVNCCKLRRRHEKVVTNNSKITGSYRCKRRPFHQRFFGLGAFAGDDESIFRTAT